MKRILLFASLFLFTVLTNAQTINSYSFESSSGTYTPLSTETILWSGTFDNAVQSITIPEFSIGGQSYTSLYVSSNGFVTFGETAPSDTYYTPISGIATYDAAVSAIGNQLRDAATGTPKISYNTNVDGEIVIQWQDVRRSSTTLDVSLNFQIRLLPSSGQIKLVYGTFNTTYVTTSTTGVQVGLRGSSNADYNNRLTTSNWSSTTAGAHPFATCVLKSTVYPASGLTFSWSLSTSCVSPTSQATNLTLGAYSTTRIDGTFAAATGADSYLVIRSNEAALTQVPIDGTSYASNDVLGNGVVVKSDASTSFAANGLSAGQEYYFHVFSMNSLCIGGPLYYTPAPLSGSAYTMPGAPSSFTAKEASTSAIELTPVSNYDVFIAWNTENVFGNPSGTYSPGDTITNGGTALYMGDPLTVPNHSGLMAGTKYYYRCWSVIGETYQTVSLLDSATTVSNVPIFIDFEETTTNGSNIESWSQEGTGADLKVYNTGFNAYSGDWCIGAVGALDRWMFRPFYLTGGQSYSVKLYAYGTSATPNEVTVQVSYGLSDNEAAMTNTIVNDTTLHNSAYSFIEGVFTPPSDGNYYIGIKAYVVSSLYSISIDDILIEAAYDCPPPSTVNATEISSSSALISWIQYGDVTEWNLKYGSVGFDPDTEGTAINNILTASQSITGLNPVHEYEVYLQSVCDGTPGVWSEPITFTTTADPISGTYTIDQTQPYSSTNFISFNQLKSFLDEGGLNGALVVNVVAGTGPYNEQLILNDVNGSSDVNTITINGNGNTLQYLSANTNQRATLKLDGAKYFSFNNLTINALGSQTGEYGYAVHLLNNADFNSFVGCTINATDASASSDFIGILASNSHTNITTQGQTASNLIIDQCVVSGGYAGIYLNGSTTLSDKLNLVLKNTEVRDFYASGIFIRNQRDALIANNEVHYTGTRSVSAPQMIAFTSNSNGTKIIGNRIHGFAGSNTTNQDIDVYGIYGFDFAGAVVDKLLIANNLIYGFDKISGNNYGIWLSGSYAQVFHNTISIDFADYPETGSQYGIYNTGTSLNIEIQNNIISIGSVNNNTKYAFYYNTTGAIQNSNFNVIFFTEPLLSSTYFGLYGTTSYQTFNDWQTTGFEANSINADPYFVSGNNLMPQNKAIDNAGVGLLGIVAVDIDSVARISPPDPGAYVFYGVCMAPVSLTNSPDESTATIGWTALNNESTWDIEYGIEGFTLGTGTLIEGINVNPFELSGLQMGTTYEVYVRSACGVSDYSDWSEPTLFTTLSSLPLDLSVSTSLAENDNECFNASNQITVAGNGQTVILPATATAAFIAGQSILFLPGFHAQAGSYVDAHITTTGEYCGFAPLASIVQNEPVLEKSVELNDDNITEPEIFDEKQITLYPNPNNGRFTLQLQNYDNHAQVMIVNLAGKVVHQSTVNSSVDLEIDMLNAPRGIYSIVVSDNETVKTSKMVVY